MLSLEPETAASSSVCFCAFVSYSLEESRPCVMSPVNSVSLRASISNQWILSSEFAHHAPPLMLSSSSEPWEPQRPEHMLLDPLTR